MKLERILVPTDLSRASLRALDDAIELAKPFGAGIILLHVSEPIYFDTPGDLYAPSGSVRMLMREWRRGEREQLARLSRALEKRRVPVRTVFAIGSPHRVIVQTARKLGADLIVMSTHGRGGISHLVMGSVAEKVVRSAACPVLTVRQAGRGRAGAARSRRKPSH